MRWAARRHRFSTSTPSLDIDIRYVTYRPSPTYLSKFDTTRPGRCAKVSPARQTEPRTPRCSRQSGRLARRVILDLVGGELKAHEQLEAGRPNRVADLGIGQRVDRGGGVPRVAFAGDL